MISTKIISIRFDSVGNGLILVSEMRLNFIDGLSLGPTSRPLGTFRDVLTSKEGFLLSDSLRCREASNC